MDRASLHLTAETLDWSLPPADPTPATPPWQNAPPPASVPSFEGSMRGLAPQPASLRPPSRPPAARFAPLSALPPDQRLPARRGEAAPTVHPSGIVPRQLPGMPDVNPSKRALQVQQIGFNCPSCLAILIIKQPENYDGQAAPCPSCGVVILPPRIAPISPFTLVSAAPSYPRLPSSVPAGPSALSVGRPAAMVSKKPGLPGAKRVLAQAAML